MAHLIILRGNSASGKTTIATKLQHSFPKGNAMLISQDTIRREILNVKDRPENPTPALIQKICEFGITTYSYIILEGILKAAIYRPMLLDLIDLFDQNVSVYYFDLSFSEALHRHEQREKSQEFGKESLQKWWLEKDYLAIPNEQIITAELTQEEIVSNIQKELALKTNQN